MTDASLAHFTASGVALVDFRSPGRPPCRVWGPVVDELAGLFSGRATVGRLDADSNRRAPTGFGLMYIPTLIVLRDGKELKRFTGLTRRRPLVSEPKQAQGQA